MYLYITRKRETVSFIYIRKLVDMYVILESYTVLQNFIILSEGYSMKQCTGELDSTFLYALQKRDVLWYTVVCSSVCRPHFRQ